MKKIKTYIVVGSYKIGELEEAVRDRIEAGFQPYGNLVVTYPTNREPESFIQPMVEYVE